MGSIEIEHLRNGRTQNPALKFYPKCCSQLSLTQFWYAIPSRYQQSGDLKRHCKRENGFREVLSFADLEVEYNGNVDNNDQTLPHGVVVLVERLTHCLMLYS
ncbi:hypothetical protein T08_10074 [Trichinella sp. T8]|nr:hypothetical protein T08_10074 [Trichinella sp. T8]